MNCCHFIGNLTRDPELRSVGAENVSVVNFSIAVNKPRKKTSNAPKEVAYVELEAWAEGAEVINKYFKKGDPIYVQASAKTETWDDKSTGQKRSKLRFRVDRFEFVGKRNKDETALDGATVDAAPDSDGKDIPF